MKSKIKFVFLVLFIVTSVFGFSSLGRDFFFCYPSNMQRSADPTNPESFYDGILILTSSYPTTGSVSNFTGTFYTPFTIPADDVTTIVIDSTFWIAESGIIEDKGLRIQADEDITAYFLSYAEPGATNDMALLCPNASLGTEYITMCWADNGATWSTAFYGIGPTYFAIAATEDDTEITITPSVNTECGRSAGVPFTITLNQFQTYQLYARTPGLLLPPTDIYDLTGSHIISDKPIAVYGGVAIGIVPNSIPAGDYLIEQIPPLVAWGNDFCVFPVQTRNEWGEDVLRVLASENGTTVTLTTGVGTTTISLDRGEYFDWDGPCDEGSYIPAFGYAAYCSGPTLDSPTFVSADKPVLLGQYIMGGVMTRGDPHWLTGNPAYDELGDPAYMLVPPIEQYSDRYVFLTPMGYNNDYLSIAIPAGYTGSVTLDGAPPTFATGWFPIPGGVYMGAVINVMPGAHIMEADTGFMLQMYAFDYNWASYATVAGQNLLRINAMLNIIKYCLETPTRAGLTTEYGIVLYQVGGDPSLGIEVTDSLPPGFTYAGGSVTYELRGSATRTGVVDPPDGANVLHFGLFNMATGDSVIINFTVNIDPSVPPGTYDNAVRAIDDEGNETSNFGGLLGTEDDCVIVDCGVILGEIVCPYPCDIFTSCEDQEMIFRMTSPDYWLSIDTMRVWFTVNDGVTPPYTVSATSLPHLVRFECSGSGASCFIVEAIISGIMYHDGATVTISLDSAYTVDDCLTTW